MWVETETTKRCLLFRVVLNVDEKEEYAKIYNMKVGQ